MVRKLGGFILKVDYIKCWLQVSHIGVIGSLIFNTSSVRSIFIASHYLLQLHWISGLLTMEVQKMTTTPTDHFFWVMCTTVG